MKLRFFLRALQLEKRNPKTLDATTVRGASLRSFEPPAILT